MYTIRVGLVVVIIALFPIVFASADLITVDGDLTDAAWSSADVTLGSDPQYDAKDDHYDIKYTRNLWDASAKITFFNMETWDTLAPDENQNFANLMIDSDNSDATGTSLHGATGIDYLFKFDLSLGDPGDLTYGTGVGTTTNYAFYKWSSSWDLMSNAGSPFTVSRGTATGGYGVEWGVLGEKIGGPPTFTWAVFVDEGTIADDDYVLKQTGHAPEPATLALFALGLGGLCMLKRRRSS